MTTAQSPMATGTGSEREVLEAFLDFHRGVVSRKVADLPAGAAQRRPVSSQTTLAGLLRHLAVTERQWFQHVLAGHPSRQAKATAIPTAAGSSASATRSRNWWLPTSGSASAPALRRPLTELDHAVAHPILGRVSLRWIYVHMIEETARHAGHADILRELTDGSTGVMRRCPLQQRSPVQGLP